MEKKQTDFLATPTFMEPLLCQAPFRTGAVLGTEGCVMWQMNHRVGAVHAFPQGPAFPS